MFLLLWRGGLPLLAMQLEIGLVFDREFLSNSERRLELREQVFLLCQQDVVQRASMCLVGEHGVADESCERGR